MNFEPLFQLFSKFLSVVFSAFFSVSSLGSPICKEPPEAPDDFTPVLRFVACSDVHLSGEEDDVNEKRFRELFNEVSAYSSAHESYKGFDAVMVCGDMTEWGREKEYEAFRKVIDEECPEETEMLVCMGNHEFIEEREGESEDAFINYKKYVSENPDTHTVINGYHFIGLSYCDKDENFGEKTKWLDSEIRKAIADTGDKPIFVFQHPHPTMTVYGSINWGNLSVRTVLSKYPQVVDFSGHSHYNSADPRSIWQGSFTAVGTGGLTGLIGNNNYVDGDAGTTIESASYYIVEADAQGNVRLQLFDAHNKVFYEECDYYLINITHKASHYYTWNNLKSFDTAPAFAEGEITAEVNENGETVISFPDAKGYYDAQSYTVTVTKGIKTVYSGTTLSDYVHAVDNGKSVNLGVLEKGEYKVKIVPMSPYSKTGCALKGEITTA